RRRDHQGRSAVRCREPLSSRRPPFVGVDELSGVRHCGQSREGPVAARSSLLVRDATLLSDRQIQKIADEAKGVWTHAGLLAKLRVRFELAKGNLAAAIKNWSPPRRATTP